MILNDNTNAMSFDIQLNTISDYYGYQQTYKLNLPYKFYIYEDDQNVMCLQKENNDNDYALYILPLSTGKGDTFPLGTDISKIKLPDGFKTKKTIQFLAYSELYKTEDIITF